MLLAQAAAPASSVITNPDWLRIPSGEDMANYYPAEAANKRLNGRVTIACDVTPVGDLANCKVVSEEPSGESFGQAALALSAIFKMKPKTLDGKPVAGGTVRIPIRFVVPPGAPLPELDDAMRCYGAVSVIAEGDPSDRNWMRALFWAMAVGARTAFAKSTPSVFEARLAEARARSASDPAASRAIAAQCAATEPGAKPSS